MSEVRNSNVNLLEDQIQMETHFSYCIVSTVPAHTPAIHHYPSMALTVIYVSPARLKIISRSFYRSKLHFPLRIT